MITGFTRDMVEQIEELLNIGIALSAEKDNTKLLQMILSQARKVTNADAGTLYLLEDDLLYFKLLQNDTMNVNQGIEEPVDLPPVEMTASNVSACAALEIRTINIADVYDCEDYDFTGPRRYDSITGYRTKSMLVVPLVDHMGDVIGVLQLINAIDENGEVIPFAHYHEAVVSSLASQAAVALTNMRHMDEINRLLHSFVQVMSTAIDARTPYNVNHTRNIANLAEKMARYLSKRNSEFEGYFDENRIDQLSMAAWLHDIGKVAIPLNVMDKPSRLGDGYDLVMSRFDYIKVWLTNRYLSLKVNVDAEAAVTTDDTENLNLEAWYDDEMKKWREAKELIVSANNPGTFVDDTMIELLKKISSYIYQDLTGAEHHWLTDEELKNLSVQRGTLTSQERKIMESHVSIGKKMLDNIRFSKGYENVPLWAMAHHEFLDGTGYTSGLKAEEIPIEVRILTLLDVFDALTASDRPYKKAMPIEKALSILGSMAKAGKLDEKLVELFTKSKVWEIDKKDAAV